MINSQDEEILCRLLKVDTLPEDVVAECEMREKWYCSCGAGGGIGPLGLIDMLRFLGYEREMEKPTPGKVDWRRVSPDVRVVVKRDGKYVMGKYKYRLGGTLGVLLPDEPEIREFRQRDVQIANDQLTPMELFGDSPEDTTEMPAVTTEFFVGQRVVVEDEGKLLDAVIQSEDGTVVEALVDGDKETRLFNVSCVRPS